MNMTPTQSMQNMYARRRMSHEHAQHKYEVRFTDNTESQDYILSFETEAKAEAAIEKNLQLLKGAWVDEDYDYGDFGNATEIWIVGSDQYARWERLWK